MEIKPRIFHGKVMHKRIFPKVNSFNYNMYYLAFPLSKLEELEVPIDKFASLSFYHKDHGYRDGSSPEDWAKTLLRDNEIKFEGDIILVTLPRILGYVFNPVSFYFCFEKGMKLKTVICEVNNTFKETHTYICAKENNSYITSNDLLEGEKIFHVSPFLERKGRYKFRFDYSHKKLGIWIDFYDGNGDKKLITSMIGKFEELNKKSLRKAFWNYPFVTMKTIFLIHWQALQLVFKRIKYISKPNQLDKKTSRTHNLTKI